MNEQKVKEVLEENDFLRGQNANYRSYCQDLADYALPRKSWINSIRTKGERIRFNFLYDSVAVRSIRIATAGFHSHLSNPTSRWFMLEPIDKKLMRRRDVRTYFKVVEDKMFMNLETSNFYNTIQEFYTDALTFGTGTYTQLRDDLETVVFNSIPVEQVGRVVDAHGRLMAIYREFKLTARQAYKLWGEDAGRSVIESLEKKPFDEFDFVHCVRERFIREAGKRDQLNMPFESLWISKKDKHLIKEGGFNEMPYISEVFYRDASDPNGFSPTMEVLPDIKLYNAMKKTMIRADMKDADPAYLLPNEGYVLPLNFNPGGINYREAGTTQKGDVEVLTSARSRARNPVELMQMIKSDIEEGLFVPLFRAFDQLTKQMTIPEIQRRVAENMVLLGPVVGRFNKGVLSPTIIRGFNILNGEDMLPPPPEALQGAQFVPVYLSPLAKAQRQHEVTEIQAFLAEVQAVGTIAPKALHKIDEDKTIDVLARIRGITPEIMREERDVIALREQEAQREQVMAGLQMAGGAAQVGKAAAEAERAASQAKAAGRK